MFRMKVEGQFNIGDRTLICGIPEYDANPEPNDIPVKIIGISFGGKPPYRSFEIEKTENNLEGKTIIG